MMVQWIILPWFWSIWKLIIFFRSIRLNNFNFLIINLIYLIVFICLLMLPHSNFIYALKLSFSLTFSLFISVWFFYLFNWGLSLILKLHNAILNILRNKYLLLLLFLRFVIQLFVICVGEWRVTACKIVLVIFLWWLKIVITFWITPT